MIPDTISPERQATFARLLRFDPPLPLPFTDWWECVDAELRARDARTAKCDEVRPLYCERNGMTPSAAASRIFNMRAVP
jgi:hypothetical protein